MFPPRTCRHLHRRARLDRVHQRQDRRSNSKGSGRPHRRDSLSARWKLLLAANCKDQSLTALDVPSLQPVVDLPLAMQPQNLCFNADGGQLFVSGEGMDGVLSCSPTILSKWNRRCSPVAIRERWPASDPAYLVVASASGSDVCILNVATRKVLGVVEVGQRPSYIAVTPDSQYALVLNEQSGDMAVIRLTLIVAKMSNAARMRSKSGASLFTMLPVGSNPVQAVVVPKGMNSRNVYILFTERLVDKLCDPWETGGTRVMDKRTFLKASGAWIAGGMLSNLVADQPEGRRTNWAGNQVQHGICTRPIG